MGSDLDRLAAGERQCFDANPELRAALNPPTSLGVRYHALHIALGRNHDLAVDHDGRGGPQVDVIALARRARAHRIDQPEKRVRALRNFSGRRQAGKDDDQESQSHAGPPRAYDTAATVDLM